MGQRIQLARENAGEAAEEAARVIRQGGIILYPTDTLYGLGADSLSHKALQTIYAIKGRDEGKPIHSIVDSLQSAGMYGIVSKEAQTLADAFLPGPLTLLLKRRETLPSWTTAGYTTFGIRMPQHHFCSALAEILKKPYTATSANKSGLASEHSVDAILTQLGDAAKYIDLIIDAGTLPPSLPSTVVDVSQIPIHITREGAISAGRIYGALSISH